MFQSRNGLIWTECGCISMSDISTFQSRNGLIWTRQWQHIHPSYNLFQSRNGLIWTLIRISIRIKRFNVSIPQRSDLNLRSLPVLISPLCGFNPATVWFEHISKVVTCCDELVSIPQRSDLNCKSLWFLEVVIMVSIPQRSDLNYRSELKRLATTDVSIPQRSDLNNKSSISMNTIQKVSIPQRSDLNAVYDPTDVDHSASFNPATVWFELYISCYIIYSIFGFNPATVWFER